MYLWLFAVRYHAHKARTFHGSLEHFLVLQTHAGVVALADITKIVDERFHGRVILPVYILCFLIAEGTLLLTWISTTILLLIMRHKV